MIDINHHPDDIATTITSDPSVANMKCMEVWGGNCSGENHIVRPGIDIWLQSCSVKEMDVCGSDLYLLSSCSSGRITRMMLADVCSQGPEFAKLVDDLRDLMKRNINSIRQTRFVNQISERLQAGSEHGCFATTIIGTYFSPTRSFSLCNSGHPPPLMFRAKEGEWSVLQSSPSSACNLEDTPGVVDASEYQHFETKFQPGDLVLSYSNALTECIDAQGHTLGVDGIASLVRQLHTEDSSNLANRLVEHVRQESCENLAVDDATVLLCQGTENSVPWRDTLLAPLRMLQKACDSTRIE